ncbi:hypothetical protein Hanom_Chr15g01414231 [Helianthus anomalus]
MFLDKTRLEAFKNGHTLKDGRFASELEEQKYNYKQSLSPKVNPT